MSNLDRRRDHPSHSPLLHLRARSPNPGGHVCAKAETRETAALRTLLLRRREGAFVGAQGMDDRRAGMITDKRRTHRFSS